MRLSAAAIFGGTLVLSLVAALLLGGNILQQVNADELVVIQAPLSGELTWHVDPGLKYQGFGKVTVYRKRNIYSFKRKVRFNDGGHADMVGSIQYEMPTDAKNLTAIHVRFGSQEAVDQQLIQTIVDKGVYFSGPTMSSKESYAEKRNLLIWYVEDQIKDGVYRTTQTEKRIKDPVTEQDKTVTVVEIVVGKNGMPERLETAVLAQFGILPFNFVITELAYDEQVEAQIANQQKITMDVQTAMAQAKQAEQRAVTAEKEGQASAMRSKWEQETIKAQAVTEAQQQKEVAELTARRKLEVARLDAEEAEQYRIAQLKRADADATYKREVMAADGALAQKLATYERVAALNASAVASHPGPWVPSIVMGGGNGDGKSPAFDFLQLLSVNAAKELGLSINPAKPVPAPAPQGR